MIGISFLKLADWLTNAFLELSYFTASSQYSFTASNFMAIGARNSQLYIYDIDQVVSGYSFLHLGNPTFSDISSIVYNNNNSNLYFSTFEYIYRVDPFSGTISSIDSNILSTNYTVHFTQSGINSLHNYDNNQLYITGINSLWYKNDFSASFSSVYDEYFFNNLKPRLLFMDYERGFSRVHKKNIYKFLTGKIINCLHSSGLFFNIKERGVSGTKNNRPKNNPAGITSEANIHLQPNVFNHSSEPPLLEIK